MFVLKKLVDSCKCLHCTMWKACTKIFCVISLSSLCVLNIRIKKYVDNRNNTLYDLKFRSTIVIFISASIAKCIYTEVSTFMWTLRASSLKSVCDVIASWPKCNCLGSHIFHVTCKMSCIHFSVKSICLILWRVGKEKKTPSCWYHNGIWKWQLHESYTMKKTQVLFNLCYPCDQLQYRSRRYCQFWQLWRHSDVT